MYREAKGFFSDVDYFCISDNYWLGQKKPCITYGLRGIVYFMVEVEGSSKDLHSGLLFSCLDALGLISAGVFGGTVHEPMIGLSKLHTNV